MSDARGVTDGESLAAIETALRRKYRVVNTDVVAGHRRLGILHPASAEELIDEIDFERDERLPYWAELWPSARVLGAYVLELQGGGRSLLELGCGSGLVTACAAVVGFRVTASDYYEDACRFARLNADRNGGSPVIGLHLDWRALPADLPRFDVVLASDVLYERPYGALVAGAIATALSDHGTAYVADPGRVGREDFLGALPGAGLALRGQVLIPFAEGEIRQSITLFEVARQADVPSIATARAHK